MDGADSRIIGFNLTLLRGSKVELQTRIDSGTLTWQSARFTVGDKLGISNALEDIKKSKRYLERKENEVEDAKEEVISLKV